MKNSATDLHNVLFEHLERVTDGEIKDEELDDVLKRAKAACQIGSVLIENGRLVLEAQKFVTENGLQINEHDQPMLAAPMRKRQDWKVRAVK